MPHPIHHATSRRDEKDENDTHSIEIKITRDNEIRVDQMWRGGVAREPTSA
jgi:hypothetical protein